MKQKENDAILKEQERQEKTHRMKEVFIIFLFFS